MGLSKRNVTNKNTENEKIKHLSLQVTLLNFFATLRLYTAVIVKC
nr:MAG TPA: hypothetical protein [Caudoviricetes sp.]